MGWAQRANLVAQDRRDGLLTPNVSKAAPLRVHSRASLAQAIREWCGLGDLPSPAPAVREDVVEPLVPRREVA